MTTDNDYRNPPRLAEILLNAVFPDGPHRSPLGDFGEVYNDIRRRRGRLAAGAWYWGQAGRSTAAALFRRAYWGMRLGRDSLRLAVRTFRRRKVYTLINILGLAIGMAAALLIMLWVTDEQSFDRFHAHADRIYRVYLVFAQENRVTAQTQTSAALAETLMAECPEVERATRIRGGGGDSLLIKVGPRQFNETRAAVTDNEFFKIFSFPFIAGDPDTALAAPGSVVLSQTAVRKYFGDADPLGNVMTLYGDDFQVTGVYQDMPPQSHFHLDVLCSFSSFEQYREPVWDWNDFKTYVQLRPGSPKAALQSKLDDIVRTRLLAGHSESEIRQWRERGGQWYMSLQALTDIHLTSRLVWEFEANGNGSVVRFFAIIALFILVIAVINYVNLATAQSTGRAREVGIRKTLGSTRPPLMGRFIMESVLTSLLALGLALALAQVLLPFYRDLVDKPWLRVPYLEQPLLPVGLVALALFIGVLAGIYPAFVLSSFRPISVLRGNLSRGLKNARLRHGLVICQFALSIFLLVGTLVVQKQMDFVQTRDLGFRREQVLVARTMGQLGSKMEAFRTALLADPAIAAVGASTTVPGKGLNNLGSAIEGTTVNSGVNIMAADTGFLSALQLKMAAGRYFSKDMNTDDRALLINESAVREFGISEPLGRQVRVSGVEERLFHIIGVVKDFHYDSLHLPVKPVLIARIPGLYGTEEDYVSIRIRPPHIGPTVERIKTTWQEMVPGTPFHFEFLDSITNDLYRTEERTGRVFTIFSLFALFVACLGLLGLASFTTEQRTREMGIRKVLGATAPALFLKQAGEFSRWVLLANLIAWPAAWLVMNLWLENFAYRTEIGPSPFALAAGLALVVTGLTVGYHALRGACADPVEALRHE
ncbi:MAG: ABC transporter permease [Acidobacteria bacterium]|nr:ABC transporter permease [Acidobacteriota bacterium]